MKIIKLLFFIFFSTYVVAQDIPKPSQSWVLLYDNEKRFVWDDQLPNSLTKKLKTIQSNNKTIMQAMAINYLENWILAYHSGTGALASYDVSHYYVPNNLSQKTNTIHSNTNYIRQIAFTPKNGWIILYNKYQGIWEDLPSKLVDKIMDLNKNKIPIQGVAFPKNMLGWVLLTEKEVFYENIPRDLARKIEALKAVSVTFKSIAFTGSDAWIILYNKNEAVWRGIPENLKHKVEEIQSQGFSLDQINM